MRNVLRGATLLCALALVLALLVSSASGQGETSPSNALLFEPTEPDEQSFTVYYTLTPPTPGGVVGGPRGEFRARIHVAPHLAMTNDGKLRVTLDNNRVTREVLDQRDPRGLSLIAWSLDLSETEYPYQLVKRLRAVFDTGTVVYPEQEEIVLADFFYDLTPPAGATRLARLEVDWQWIACRKTLSFEVKGTSLASRLGDAWWRGPLWMLGLILAWDSSMRLLYYLPAVRGMLQRAVTQLARSLLPLARNIALVETWQKLTPLGEQISRYAKSLSDQRTAGKTIEQLVESAARPSGAWIRLARVGAVLGTLAVVASVAIAWHNIASAPPDMRAQVAAGEVGFWAGSWTLGLLAGKAAMALPIPHPLVKLVVVGGATIGGSMVGAFLGTEAGQALYSFVSELFGFAKGTLVC